MKNEKIKYSQSANYKYSSRETKEGTRMYFEGKVFHKPIYYKKMEVKNLTQDQQLRERSYELALRGSYQPTLAMSGEKIKQPDYIAQAKKIYKFIKTGK